VKQLWRDIRGVLRGAGARVLLGILAALAAAVGVVQVADQPGVVQLLDEPADKSSASSSNSPVP